MYVTLEGSGGNEVLLEVARESAASIDPFQPVDGPWTFDAWMRNPTSQPRLLMTLAMSFAALALVLATVGTYAMVTSVLAQRTRAIAVRVALGAQSSAVVRHVLAQGLGPLVAGLAVGIAIALAASHLLTGVLYGISATDPMTYLLTGAVLLGTTLLACVGPICRSLRINPVAALREE
jgi:putative ABC transport system permease protein